MIHYNIAKKVLNYDETKPTVYTIRQLCYPVIQEKALIEYISNSAAIPRATVKAAVAAISEAISYFVINGHRVNFQDFGSFYLKFKSKTAEKPEELQTDMVKNITIGFQSCHEMAKLAKNTGVSQI